MLAITRFTVGHTFLLTRCDTFCSNPPINQGYLTRVDIPVPLLVVVIPALGGALSAQTPL